MNKEQIIQNELNNAAIKILETCIELKYINPDLQLIITCTDGSVYKLHFERVDLDIITKQP